MDHIYKHFSEEGAHATFTAARQRLRMKRNESKGTQEIAIKLGGVKDRARQMSILIYSIQLAGQAIIQTRSAFAKRLHDVDITEMVTNVTDTTNVFYGHFFDTFDRSNVDMEPLKIVMRVLRDMRHGGENLTIRFAALMVTASKRQIRPLRLQLRSGIRRGAFGSPPHRMLEWASRPGTASLNAVLAVYSICRKRGLLWPRIHCISKGVGKEITQ